MAQKGLRGRVIAAAEEALERQKSVCAIDVCIGLGWLHSRHIDNWRQGRAASVEPFLPVPHSRIAEVTDHLQQWAGEKGLTPSVADYTSATHDRRQLHFTKGAKPELEQAWRTHWLAADLPERQQARI